MPPYYNVFKHRFYQVSRCGSYPEAQCCDLQASTTTCLALLHLRPFCCASSVVPIAGWAYLAASKSSARFLFELLLLCSLGDAVLAYCGSMSLVIATETIE